MTRTKQAALVASQAKGSSSFSSCSSLSVGQPHKCTQSALFASSSLNDKEKSFSSKKSGLGVVSQTVMDAFQELESLTLLTKEDEEDDDDDGGLAMDALERVVQLFQWVEELQESGQGLKELQKVSQFLGDQPPNAQISKVRPRRSVTMEREEEEDDNVGLGPQPKKDKRVRSNPLQRLFSPKDKDDKEDEDEDEDEELELDAEEDEFGRMDKLKKVMGVSGLAAVTLLSMRESWRNSRPIGYQSFDNHKEFPDYDLGKNRLMKHCRGTPPSQYFFSTRKLYRWFVRYLQARLAQVLSSFRTNRARTYEEKQETFFSQRRLVWNLIPNPWRKLLPPPPVLQKVGCLWWRSHRWEADEEMARQYFAGLHPLSIRNCRNVRTELTPELVDALSASRLEELASRGCLLYASYMELESLSHNPHEAFPPVYNQPPKNRVDDRCVHPAMIVFGLEPRQRRDLEILAIQLNLPSNKTEDASTTPHVFSPETTSDPNEWLMAKICVQVADAQYHQWVSHLGNTHLAVEPHIIAIHNTLKQKDHPLYIFFKPLMKDTLFLNWAARQTTIAYGENSFGDYFSSVGVGQSLQLIQKHWETYSFFESSGLPQELASRGFTDEWDFPGYLYQTDGLQLWEAMGDFAKDFVEAVYPSDESVVQDAVLQEWAHETSHASKAHVPGFPTSFTHRSTLTQVLQTLLWMTSALHAAVSSPQYDYMAYTPNKPFSLRRGMTDYLQEGRYADNPRDWIFRLALPYVTAAKRTAVMAHVLTLPSETCLDNLHRHFRGTVGEAAYERFVRRLDAIGDTIEQRNQQNKRRGKPIYPYLHPSVVPASIDI